MRPEEEMILCFVKAGALMRSLTFCIMGAADTSKAFDEFLKALDRPVPQTARDLIGMEPDWL